MTHVKYVLQTKGHTTLSIDPTVSVFDALTKMAEHDVGSLLVMKAGKVVGLFTERDFARKVALHGQAFAGSSVGDMMTEEVLYVTPDTTVEECMALMTEKHTRHLPVLENDRLVGIVSIGDVLKKLIADKNFQIEQLERYITG